MCGCMLMHSAMNHEAHSQAAPTGAAAGGTACAHCGFPLRAGFAFCPGCGMRAEQGECPACGQPVEAGWKACAHCGSPLVAMNRSMS